MTREPRPAFVVCFTDGSARTWDIRARAFVGDRFVSGQGPQRLLACTRLAGRTVAASAPHYYDSRQDHHDIWVWDILTGKPLYGPLRLHHHVTAVTFANLDGEVLGLSAGRMRTLAGSPELRAWRVTDGCLSPRSEGLEQLLLRDLSDVAGITAMSGSRTADRVHVAAVDPRSRPHRYTYLVSTWDTRRMRSLGRHRIPQMMGDPQPRYNQAAQTELVQEVQYRRKPALLLTGHLESTLLDEGLRLRHYFRGPTRRPPPPGTRYQALRAAGDRLLLVAYTYDAGGIEVHDFESGRPVGPPVIGHSPYGGATTFTVDDGAVVAAAGTVLHGGTARWLVWRVDDGEIMGDSGPLAGGAGVSGAYPTTL